MKHISLFLVLLMMLSLPQAKAQSAENLDFSTWKTLPILHEGRLKPLDSFGRITLKKFSNQETLKELNASEWLALSLFDPTRAIEIPVFKIRDPQHYSLPNKKSKLYSYEDLSNIVEDKKEVIQKLVEAPQENWSDDQINLMTLYENYILYTQILRSMSLLLPLNIENDSKNFLDYKKRQQELNEKVRNIVRNKGTDIEKYTDEERELSFLSYQINLLESSAQNNILLRIIPLNSNDKHGDWVSPWGILQQGVGTPQSTEYFKIWQDMAQAYREDNTDQWKQTTSKATALFVYPRLKIEVLYNKLHLLQVAIFLYVLSILVFILSKIYLAKKTYLEKIALSFLSLGAFCHFVHMALRIYILARPPVGTLYESILFVSLISVVGLLFLAWKQRNNIFVLLSSLSGLILLTTAQGFTGDDTMNTLVAVLNTNFWLGTHVICITMGYGTCLITSLMAHYDLVMRKLKPDNESFFKRSYANIKTIAILSLLLTTIGTILGGIWADQSWGRFWGWDPKENGALLIVLWPSWLLHGRVSNHISKTGFVVGSAFLSIVVVLAWFGVNLLNVGLHSYGFISGVAAGILAFCLFEIMLIGGLWYLSRPQGRTA